MKVLIIGGGSIGKEYAKICCHMNLDTTLMSRSFSENFEMDNLDLLKSDIYDIKAKILEQFTHCIVAVQPRYTFKIISYLLDNTSAFLLVEKPLCLYRHEFEQFSKKIFDSRIYVAFNRRFFESTLFAKELIKDDEIIFLEVCFTELLDRIRGNEDEVKNWGMCNTIHLFDMAFHLCGSPENLKVKSYAKNEINSYNVTGKLKNGYLSMQAHWGAPGNWGLTITTSKKKLFFDPLETLRIQNKGSFKKINIDLNKDNKFKNGFHKQTEKFLHNVKEDFCSFEQYNNLIYTIELIFFD